MRRFRSTPDGIEIRLGRDERDFLAGVVPMLAGVGDAREDPAADRLRVPVYLDDSEADSEWWRLMGDELAASRDADRSVFDRVLSSEPPVTLDEDEANAFLRVINEARLVLGARLGVEVESDYAALPRAGRSVLGFLGWVLEDLTDELSRRL